MLLVLFIAFLALFAFFMTRLFSRTRRETHKINQAFPPCGSVAKVNGYDVHFVDTAEDRKDANQPTIVFLHGASSNLRDPLHVFKDKLADKARLVFIDRPGLGWSTRSKTMHAPSQQATQVMGLLGQLKIDKAIFVGHSWSGTLIAKIAIDYPERVAGLLFNAPVSHPWPGGVNWYYHIAAHRLFGPLFCNTLTLPIGMRQLDCAMQKVFWPNPVPDNYSSAIGDKMVLTPSRFRANSKDIVHLSAHVAEQSKHYHKITAPTTIITGDKDQIVFPWLHSKGLNRDIAHARLVWLKETGHMPHHSASDLFVTEIEALLRAASAPKQDAAE